ncbi:DUF3667 domain-containing protein [Aestuariivivens insulae]|uniref:DUF3667 domain-containing protein n=1 Tax=Aestuariivivens insulae TaxID=1621988 RepID=UPI001F58911E|nr:DUF3667 domain-containing protein [Aestuariivivens insulae]
MTCKNCNTTLNAECDYCYKCGGKVIRKRLTLRNLFEYFTATFFNYDNTFFQTFITLFKKPEAVIGGYINGVRKKYVNVISFFALALTITGLEWFFLNTYFPNVVDISNLYLGNGNHFLANSTYKLVQEHSSLLMMLFVPVYALMSRLVFFNRKEYNYTEHLVIFMYILSQLAIISTALNITGAFLGISLGKLAYINLPFQVIFSAYCLRRLYNLSLIGIILRTLWFFIVFIVIYILVILVFAGILILLKGPEFFKDIIAS